MSEQTIIAFGAEASFLEILANTNLFFDSGVQEVASVVTLLAVACQPINADILFPLVVIGLLVQGFVDFLEFFDAFVVEAIRRTSKESVVYHDFCF